MRAIFWLIANTKPHEWKPELLCSLSSQELSSLCGIMGIARGGTKDEKVRRIHVAMLVRISLNPFGGDDGDHNSENEAISKIVNSFTSSQLRQMAKNIKIFQGYTKRQSACSLLIWRNKRRKAGKEYIQILKRKEGRSLFNLMEFTEYPSVGSIPTK